MLASGSAHYQDSNLAALHLFVWVTLAVGWASEAGAVRRMAADVRCGCISGEAASAWKEEASS